MAEKSGFKLFMDISDLGRIMDVLKRHRLKSSEKLDELGIKLGLSDESIVVIRKYRELLTRICECLVLPRDDSILALYAVHLREILSLWLMMVDNVYQRGGATWVALDYALYEVDKVTAMKIRREQEADFEKKYMTSPHDQLNLALKEGTIRVRYTNLLLCGQPGSGRSSFLRLLLGGDVNDDNPIARMIMRTPKLKFKDLAKHRWEWDKLDYAILRTIVTSHVKSGRPVDEQSSHVTKEQQLRHHSTDKPKDLLSSDEYSFEDLLIKSLSQRIEQQNQLFKLQEGGNLQEAIDEWKSDAQKGSVEPKAEFHKLLLQIPNERIFNGYVSSVNIACKALSQLKSGAAAVQLIQKEEVVHLFEKKLHELADFCSSARFHDVLSMFFLPLHEHQMFGSNFDCFPNFSYSTHPVPSPPPIPSPPSQPLDSPHPSSVCNDILHSLPTAQLPDGKALHFINIIAMSGPLSFLDAIPAILSYTTVNLITHRLDIPLEEEDSIDVLDSLIRSLSFSQKPHTEGVMARMEPEHNKKMFAVVGSCFDRINEDILDKKNELLDKRFGKFRDNLLLDAGSILFAVNNLKRSENEEEKLMLIRRKVCQHYVEADIPIRWYLLQLELMRAQESCDVLPLDEVLRIGETWKMLEDDVKNALLFFHDMAIIFYFPVVLPGVVFIKPQVLISKLLALTNRSDLQANQPGLVDSNSVKAGEGDVFTSDQFLQLLEGLLIVSKIPDTEGKYLAPFLLPKCDQYDKKRTELYKNPHSVPLIFAWDQKMPCGLFQALCVELGQSGWGFPSKYLHNLVSFRDKQVTLINHDCCWIEIYYEGDDLKAPSEIKNKIYNLMQEMLKLFNIDTIGLRPLEEYSFCSQHRSMDHLCSLSTDSGKTAICLLDGSEFKLTDKQESWLDAGAKSGRHKVPQSLDIRDLNKVLTALKNGHFNGRWEDLGLQLGLYKPTLSKIQADNRSNNACLRECIARWLQRADGVDSKGGANYATLVKALEEMNQKNTADHIRTLSPLTVVHLIDVLRLLNEGHFYEADWSELGLQLGLRYSTIRSIETNNPRDSHRCLRECIVKWLQRADDVDRPSYVTLAEALNKMGQRSIADHIHSKGVPHGQKEEKDDSGIPIQILKKPPKMSDLTRIFKPYAHQYHIIGSALNVGIEDLMTSPITADQKVILIFHRWIASNKEVTWKKMLEVCQDYPNELGKAKHNLILFLKSERARKSYLN